MSNGPETTNAAVTFGVPNSDVLYYNTHRRYGAYTKENDAVRHRRPRYVAIHPILRNPEPATRSLPQKGASRERPLASSFETLTTLELSSALVLRQAVQLRDEIGTCLRHTSGVRWMQMVTRMQMLKMASDHPLPVFLSALKKFKGGVVKSNGPDHQIPTILVNDMKICWNRRYYHTSSQESPVTVSAVVAVNDKREEHAVFGDGTVIVIRAPRSPAVPKEDLAIVVVLVLKYSVRSQSGEYRRQWRQGEHRMTGRRYSLTWSVHGGDDSRDEGAVM
ncbi:hypothetical protein H4582DRAFT_2054088 [Lactarius indigo]|nr:hypothetical protein H4582DRAFT_2054088 [Lactarius indigo]